VAKHLVPRCPARGSGPSRCWRAFPAQRGVAERSSPVENAPTSTPACYQTRFSKNGEVIMMLSESDGGVRERHGGGPRGARYPGASGAQQTDTAFGAGPGRGQPSASCIRARGATPPWRDDADGQSRSPLHPVQRWRRRGANRSSCPSSATIGDNPRTDARALLGQAPRGRQRHVRGAEIHDGSSSMLRSPRARQLRALACGERSAQGAVVDVPLVALA
jgi:hypothetical protein